MVEQNFRSEPGVYFYGFFHFKFYFHKQELSKTMVVLKAENAKLRNYNKELSLQNLTFHNEIIKNRNELAKWRKKFTKLQTLHIHHIETLTGELQSYTDKIAYVFGVEDVDCEPEDTSRVTEQQSTVVNSPSISEDALPQGSKVLETQMPQNAIPEQIDENRRFALCLKKVCNKIEIFCSFQLEYNQRRK